MKHVREAARDPHVSNAGAIIEAIRRAARHRRGPVVIDPPAIGIHSPRDYQHVLCRRFADIISRPAIEYLSKSHDSWLLVGDRRRELSADIRLLMESIGLGPALLVLHLQQIRTNHILHEVREGGANKNLSVASESLQGTGGERIISIPLRQYRADFARLADLGIAKPVVLWDPTQVVSHEGDGSPCVYCSCGEINPAEVTVDIAGSRFGLSRDYTIGFTFAPFGNPARAVHFVAWDRGVEPLNMNRVSMTVSDLAVLTKEINRSVRAFFADTGAADFPLLSGLSNGWAGNTVYHQHFQFFAPEYPLPVLRASPRDPPIVHREDVNVGRLDWPTAVYRVRAPDALTAGLVGNDLAAAWCMLSGTRRVPYKSFPPDYAPGERDLVPAHTMNVVVPGDDSGRTLYIFLRDRERIHYLPDSGPTEAAAAGPKTPPKYNLASLEVAGHVIVDDTRQFEAMRAWTPGDVSRAVRAMIASVSPSEGMVALFEAAVAGVLPR